MENIKQLQSNIKTYKKGDNLPWLFPMKAGEEVTIYEENWINIQFLCYKKELEKYVLITSIDSNNPWSWKFDETLSNFCKVFKNGTEIQVLNLLNGDLKKYMDKYNIRILNI